MYYVFKYFRNTCFCFFFFILRIIMISLFFIWDWEEKIKRNGLKHFIKRDLMRNNLIVKV